MPTTPRDGPIKGLFCKLPGLGRLRLSASRSSQASRRTLGKGRVFELRPRPRRSPAKILPGIGSW